MKREYIEMLIRKSLFTLQKGLKYTEQLKMYAF